MILKTKGHTYLAHEPTSSKPRRFRVYATAGASCNPRIDSIVRPLHNKDVTAPQQKNDTLMRAYA